MVTLVILLPMHACDTVKQPLLTSALSPRRGDALNHCRRASSSELTHFVQMFPRTPYSRRRASHRYEHTLGLLPTSGGQVEPISRGASDQESFRFTGEQVLQSSKTSMQNGPPYIQLLR